MRYPLARFKLPHGRGANASRGLQAILPQIDNAGPARWREALFVPGVTPGKKVNLL